MAEWASLRAKVIALKGIPLSLFGYSLIRAWISLLYANPALSEGGQGMGSQLLFDAAFVGASVAMALGARRLTPLNDKPIALERAPWPWQARCFCRVRPLRFPQLRR